MPTFNTSMPELTRAVESVSNQFYTNWELCIADGRSSRQELRDLIDRMAAEDTRIKRLFRPSNGGIAAATNSALELASRAYVALLDHDDELAPHALAAVAEALRKSPDVDILYSDENKIAPALLRFSGCHPQRQRRDWRLPDDENGRVLARGRLR
jgi:O-antigen biosynthesis protein